MVAIGLSPLTHQKTLISKGKMMREVKFEILIEKHNRDFSKEIIKHYTTLDRLIDGSDPLDYSAVDIIAKRQYTGLNDCNGVEIYEGDIVKSKCYPFYSDAPEMDNGKDFPEELNYLGVVGIDVDGVFYDLKVVSDRVAGRACGGNLSELDGREVIGNIHQNPELLNA